MVLAGFAGLFGKLIAVIILWLIALMFWGASTFSLRAFANATGVLRLLCGAVVALGALYLLDRTLPEWDLQYFSYFAIGTFLAALVAEFAIGEDVRGRR